MYNQQSITGYLQKLFNEEKYEESLSYLENIKNDKELPEELQGKVDYYSGRIKFYQEKLEEAVPYFISALKSNPEDVYSLIFLARIMEQNKKTNAALKLLDRVYSINPEYKHILLSIENLIKYIQDDDDIIKNLKISGDVKSISKKLNPKVSIIVLCYNKMEFTVKCLKSIFENTFYNNFEVIVVDNASADDTPAFLESYGDQIKYIHLDRNFGFVGGNNIAAKYAEGEYILFLNNDTEVQPKWLDSLYKTFTLFPDAGAVGSMLIYPDGKLQEAGSAIFNDMNGWNYGKNGLVMDSRYNFVREVDYCSGAALMVKKNLFEKLNGFDERYAPAYCEDTDLCFGIRKLGFKVYFNPFSKVIHFEGATSGTDLNSGFKKYQVINGEKFKEKWKEELKLQSPNNPELAYQFSNRHKGKRVLIIDDIPPLPDRAAGALRHYHTLTQMLELGYQVTYVHLMGRQYSDESGLKYINNFRMRGVEFIWFGYENWWAMRETPQVKPIIENLIAGLELKKRNLDLIYIAFWHIADYFVDIIRGTAPEIPILVDTMDIHYLRELRQAEAAKSAELKKSAELNKEKELALYSKVDCVTTVTENDRDELRKYLNNKSILILTDVHDPKETKNQFEERKDFVFVGNFNHTPNEDAVIYYSKDIFPAIKKKLPDAKFYIVGNNPTEKVKKLASGDIIVTGWVPEVQPYLDKCRVAVVPLRYGAGNKGKVGEALSYGLPMVSTTIGAEGMNIVNGVHAYVADDPAQFAEYAVKLYTDKNIWNDFSTKGKSLIASQYSSELMRKRLEYILSYSSRDAFRSDLAVSMPNPPKVSIILVTYNQYEYTQKCINSIFKHTKKNYEVIVVDNASADNTVKELKKNKNIRLICNNENLGFPKAVNQGINAAIGENILLLNNDTVVTEGWLERMVEVIESHPSIGIVGPMSNSVSGVQLDQNAKYNTMQEMELYAAKIKEINNKKAGAFPRVAFLCTLIKRELIDKIGGLDERFTPGNFEDDDFCLRAQLAGYKTVIAADVFIHHYGSKSFTAKGTGDYQKRLDINKQIFVEKWGADPEGIWLRNEKINSRSFKCPINKNTFIQNYERAAALIEDNDFIPALAAIEDAIKIFNTYEYRTTGIGLPELYELGGNIALIISDLEKAKEFFERELQLCPNSSNACLGIGTVFFASEMYEEAKTLFEWAVKNDAGNSKAAEFLAKVNSVLGLVEADSALPK